MIKTSHRTLYALSGAIWFGIGIMLLNLGLGYLMHGFQGKRFVEDGYSGVFCWLSSLTGGFDNAAVTLVLLSLVVGFMKGRFVLQKTALRSSERIAKLSNPTTLTSLYSPSNLLLIGVMMGLGMLMRFLSVPFDLRGSIDTAVGCALMQGSLAYFRLMSAKTLDPANIS